jgi:hypothetical protein
MSARHVEAEDLRLQPGEQPYDLVLAVRVGALDGRYPTAGELALRRIASVSTEDTRLSIDGGNPLRELALPRP